ncbi:MAG TPA: M23 family metallopeptidase [Acidimicrobiia bacterium]|nr:M23 family metallopeptidase [Acidimicrobiia bacterium]
MLVSVVVVATAFGSVPAHADDHDHADDTTDTVTSETTDTPVAVDPPDTPDTPDTPVTVAPAPGPRRTFTPVKRYNVLRKLVFPVVGLSKFWSGFGDCRDSCTREHHGIDIFTYGYKGFPIVAAHDGTVTKVTYDEGNPGCSVRIRSKDRWETRYYHLNNDVPVPGTDEIGAPCPAPGIEVGTEVVAGQIIGYMGDSGNAEDTPPHLHFELRNRSGYPIDPYRSLKNAARVTYEWLPTDPQVTTMRLSEASHTSARMLTIIDSEDMHRVGASEAGATFLESPLLAIDRTDPTWAISEIKRLAPERILIMHDDPGSWLEQLARPLAPIVARWEIPDPHAPVLAVTPDAVVPVPFEYNPPDRFTTIIAGVVDRIHRSRVETFEAYAFDHLSIVLTSETWAPHGIGEPSRSWPGKGADQTLLWWHTGTGWVGTSTIDEAPHPGFAYVTEKLAQPQTLNFLSSLAELPPHPVWLSP